MVLRQSGHVIQRQEDRSEVNRIQVILVQPGSFPANLPQYF